MGLGFMWGEVDMNRIKKWSERMKEERKMLLTWATRSVGPIRDLRRRRPERAIAKRSIL